MQRIEPLEKEIENDILRWLGLKNIYSWKVKTVGTFDTKLGRFRKSSPLYKKGVSDILGILDDGTFLALEVKSKNGKATHEQKMFLDNITRRGGVASIVRSVEDVARLLRGHIEGDLVTSDSKPSE